MDYKLRFHVPLNGSYFSVERGTHYSPWCYLIIDVVKKSDNQVICLNPYFVNPSCHMYNRSIATGVFNCFDRMLQQQWSLHEFVISDGIFTCRYAMQMLGPAEIGYLVLGFIRSIGKEHSDDICIDSSMTLPDICIVQRELVER